MLAAAPESSLGGTCEQRRTGGGVKVRRMKGADKQKKGTRKAAQKSLKEKRQEKRAAKKLGG